MLLGARAGYVLRTDPSSSASARFHLEARLTYLVGHDAVTTEGLSPLLLVGLGAGELDAYVPVLVNAAAGSTTKTTSGTENAWLTAGPIFTTVGAGARALFGRSTAVTRAAFVLCELEEQSSVEAALVLNVPEGTVRTRLLHAKRKLRAWFERRGMR